MERLTKRHEDGQAVMDCNACRERHINDQDMYCSALYCRNRLKDRVADYEDTGMEPQEIEKIRQDVEAGFLKQTARRYGIDVDRIHELVNADREGRCVVLPDVDERARQSMGDGLEDVFKEWAYEDSAVGLFGMSDGEKQLANALLAVLKGKQDV